MDGWIKLHRQLVEWEWYKDEKVKSVFIHLLIKANHQDNRWQGIVVKKGQVITGRKVLAEELGLSERSIRTSLNKLKSTNEIAIKTTNKFSLITIVNYDFYQGENNKTTNKTANKVTNDRPSNDQQTTTNKNDNNDKNEKNIIIKPTLEEIDNYIKEKDYEVDPEYFYSYYESNGWKVGKNKMKSWKATLSTWNKRTEAERKKNTPNYINYTQRKYHDLDRFYSNIVKE